MKRVAYFFSFALATWLLAGSPARAISEFCPINFQMARIAPATAPGSLFGLELKAEGPRSVTATLAFDTSAGWFVASVPKTTLNVKERHFDSPSASFIKREWISPLMYVRFPTEVRITHSWVYVAQATDDDFGWSKQGQVACQPPAAAHPVEPSPPNTVRMDPKDRDVLTTPPGPGATVLIASKSPPLKQSNCATPFVDAAVTRLVSPEYPMMARRPLDDVTSMIEVAVNADGSVADAWVFYPSGFSQLDDAARQAALDSKYRNGRSYCEAAPGTYLFRVTFTNNSRP